MQARVHGVHRLAQGKKRGTQGNDEGVGIRRLVFVKQTGTMPGRSAGCACEPVQFRKTHNIGGNGFAVLQGIKQLTAKTHLGLRRALLRGEFGHSLQGFTDRNMPQWVARRQCMSVICERRAGFDQLTIKICGIRLCGILVTHDSANKLGSLIFGSVFCQQIVAQIVKPGASQKLAEGCEGRTFFSHDQNRLSAPHQG